MLGSFRTCRHQGDGARGEHSLHGIGGVVVGKVTPTVCTSRKVSRQFAGCGPLRSSTGKREQASCRTRRWRYSGGRRRWCNRAGVTFLPGRGLEFGMERQAHAAVAGDGGRRRAMREGHRSLHAEGCPGLRGGPGATPSTASPDKTFTQVLQAAKWSKPVLKSKKREDPNPDID